MKEKEGGEGGEGGEEEMGEDVLKASCEAEEEEGILFEEREELLIVFFSQNDMELYNNCHRTTRREGKKTR